MKPDKWKQRMGARVREWGPEKIKSGYNLDEGQSKKLNCEWRKE